MRDFPPNISPRLQTLTAIILAYAFGDDFTAQEQIAIGNWLIQIGQTMITTAQFQRVIEERIVGNIVNINSRQFKCGGSPYVNPSDDPHIKSFYENIYKQATKDDFDYIQNAINKLNEKIEQIKKEVEK